MTTMKIRRRKIWPAGYVTLLMNTCSAGLFPNRRFAATPDTVPAIIPMKILLWRGRRFLPGSGESGDRAPVFTNPGGCCPWVMRGPLPGSFFQRPGAA